MTMNKLIIDNRTSLSLADIMPYVLKVLEMGYVSNDNTQYCYHTVWGSGISISAIRNDKSDRFVVFMENVAGTKKPAFAFPDGVNAPK